MSLGLTRSSNGVLSDPPTYLSDEDWGLICFKISPSPSAPIDFNCGVALEAILAQGFRDGNADDFFLRTIPEAPPILFVGLGLIVLVIWNKKTRPRLNPASQDPARANVLAFL